MSEEKEISIINAGAQEENAYNSGKSEGKVIACGKDCGGQSIKRCLIFEHGFCPFGYRDN